MKKLLSILLVLLLCLGLMTACGGGNTDDGNDESAKLEAAADAVEALFTGKTSTAEDYELDSTIEVDGVTYTITWAISNTEGVSLSGNTVTVAKDPAAAINYTLTATVKGAGDATATATISLTVPAAPAPQYNSWDEYVAAEDGKALYVKGVVTAIFADAYAIQDDGKAYYVTGATDGLTVGVTVDVKGTKAVAQGNYRIAATEVKVTNTTATVVEPADYTTVLQNAANLKDEALVANQGLLVVIKQATIGKYTASSKQAAFSVGENEAYIKLSTLSNADAKTVSDLHKANEGNYANFTGIIQVQNGNFYLVPVSAEPITSVTERTYTDAEKIALIVDAIKVAGIYTYATDITVPTAGEKGGTVAWTSDNAAVTYADGKFTIAAIPAEYTEVTVTAAITAGETTETKTYKLVLSELKNTVDIIKAAQALEAGKALPIPNVTLEGFVPEIVSEYDATKGITFKLVVKNLNDYALTVTLTGESASGIVAGDTVMVTGQVKKDDAGVVILNNATLDKISSGGNKITFDLALPASNVLFLNVKESDTNTVTVIDDDGDKVLQINKPNGGTAGNKQTAVDYYYPTLSEGDDVYVFEAAITLLPDADNPNNFETCFYTIAKNDAGEDTPYKVFQVEYTWENYKTSTGGDQPNANKVGNVISVCGYGKIDNGSLLNTGKVATTATVGSEFTVRMEYYVDEKAPRTVVYINDQRCIDTNTVYFTAQQGAKPGVVTAVTHAEMQAYGSFKGKVNLDDLNVYTYKKTLDFEDGMIPEENFLADTKQWKAANDNKFSVVTEGDNKYLKLEKVNTPTGVQSAVDVYDFDGPDRVYYAEFSGRLNINNTETFTKAADRFEILIRSIKDTADVSCSDDDAKVAEAIFSIQPDNSITVRLNARRSGSGASAKPLGVKQGEWFTYKLVYEVIDENTASTTLYINGEEFLKGESAACYNADKTAKIDAKFGELQCYTAYVGTVLYDDLAIDFKSAPIDWDVATPGKTEGEATSDLGTIGTANKADFAEEKKTTAGWVAVNSQYVVDNATAGKPAVVLNGKVGAAGALTSPVLTDGVSKVTFGYAALDAKQVAFKVEILKDGKTVAANDTVYVKVARNTAYVYTWELEEVVGGDFQIKITNLSLNKAEEDLDLIAIWDVAYEVGTLPTFADKDFEDGKTNGLTGTTGHTVKDGKLQLSIDGTNVKSGHTGILMPNASEGNVYSDAYQYVVSFDFIFNGATLGSGTQKTQTVDGVKVPVTDADGNPVMNYDKNLAFVGFVTKPGATSYGNGNMAKWGYMGMAGVSKAGDEATGVTLYGLTFTKGVAYNVEIVYVVGSGKYVITATDADGKVTTSTFTASSTSGVTDTTLIAFNMYWRGSDTRYANLSITFDNMHIAIEDAPNNGRNGISKYSEDSINFNKEDDTTLAGVITGGVSGTVGGTMKEDVTKSGNWVSVIGALGANKYVSLGHTGGSSATTKFKPVDAGKDPEFKADTMVVEFDFMLDDAGYVKRTVTETKLDADGNPVQAKNEDGTPKVDADGKPVYETVSKTVYDKVDWALKFVFSLNQDMNTTITPTPAKPAVEEVKDKDGNVITPAQAAVPGSFTMFGKAGYEFDKWYTVRIEVSKGDAFTSGEGEAAKTFHKVAVTYYVNNEKIGDTAVRSDWASATKNWEAVNGFYVQTRGYCQYASCAIDNVYVGMHTAGYEPSLKTVDAPEAGKAYKLYLTQGNLENDPVLYFNGEMAKTYYYGTTEDVTAAMDVTLEDAGDGKYYMAFTKDGAKQYLCAYVSGTHTNVKFVTDVAEATKWTYNTTIKSMTTTLTVEDVAAEYYVGTYNNFNTLSLSKTSYVLNEDGTTKDAYETSSFCTHFGLYE